MKAGAKIGDDLVIRHLIGEGGYAETYLATQKNTGEHLVVKKLKVKSLEAQELFKKEALVLLGLNHQNIVHGVSYLAFESEQFLIMEHVAGKPLAFYVGASLPLGLRFQLAWAVGLQVSRALCHCLSTMKVSHNDISAKNLIVCPNDSIKIIDFGLAQFVPELEVSKSMERSFTDVRGLTLTMLQLIQAPETSLIKNSFGNLNQFQKYLLSIIRSSLSEPDLPTNRSIHEFNKELELAKAKYGLCDKKIIRKAQITLRKKALLRRNGYRPLFQFFGELSWLSLAFASIFFMLFSTSLDFLLPQESLGRPSLVEQSFGQEVLNAKVLVGTLSINSVPRAHIFINEDYIGVAPIKNINLEEGEYLVRLQSKERHSLLAVRKVRIKADKHTELVHQF